MKAHRIARRAATGIRPAISAISAITAVRDEFSRIAVAAVSTVLFVAMSATADAQPNRPVWPPAEFAPIRTVRVGLAHVPAWKENIQMQVTACQVVKSMPPVPAELPGDAALAQFPIGEVEELFDGSRHATYTTGSAIGADPSAGCALRIFKRFHVDIELGCTGRIFGGTTLLGHLMDLEAPKPPDVSLQQDAVRSTRCSRVKLEAYDPTGLPTDDASGTRCIWQSEFLKRSLGGLGVGYPGGEENGDLCLYAAFPAVASGNGRQLVVLKTRFANRSLAGTWLPETFGAVQATNQSLKEFSVGTPIPASRFTMAAARQFLNQPVKLGLDLR